MGISCRNNFQTLACNLWLTHRPEATMLVLAVHRQTFTNQPDPALLANDGLYMAYTGSESCRLGKAAFLLPYS